MTVSIIKCPSGLVLDKTNCNCRKFSTIRHNTSQPLFRVCFLITNNEYKALVADKGVREGERI